MKQIKFLGVLAIALALGLTACGGGKSSSKTESKSEAPSSSVPASSSEAPAESSEAPADSSEAPAESSESSTKHTHQWGEYETTKAATCTEDGEQKRVCSICGQEQTKTIKAAHTWGDYVVKTPATCSAVGKEERECSVCHDKQERDIAKIDHTLVEVLPEDDNNVPEGGQKATAATCTEAGVKVEVCSVCHERIESPINALGHDWDEWVDINPADCTHDGLHKHTCKRCNIEEQEEVPALGHDIQLIGDDTEPEAGKAKVRLYSCANGCGQTYIGFKATEVSDASKARLVFEDGDKEGEKGARFFGHPIGNDVELDPTTGDPTEGNPAVYSKEQTGDFFEYVFDLTQEQVDALGTEGCLMYCDAKPANWMQQNNMDFFAKGSETDWTVAYYIDDDPAHYNDAEQLDPKEIEGWRYVLYVNDHYAELDANVATNKMANNNRGEFVLPYVFHFTAGTNKISLRMAAGYRCTFFNFTFRPVPNPIVIGQENIEIRQGQTAQITSEMPNLSYKSADVSIATVSETGLVTGVKAGSTTITVSKDGNYKPVSLPVTILEKEGVVTLALTDGVIAPEGGVTVYNSSSSGTWYRNFNEGATVTYTFNSTLAGKFDIQLGLRGSNIDLASNISIKVNNVDVTVSGTVNTQYSAVDYVVGEATLQAGENTMVITALATSSLYMQTLKLIPQA